jgi:PAS domain S-box-containing protein
MAKILLVDDRPGNRQFLVTLLGSRQHRLLETSDGAEALEVARRERPDLIISEVLMPTMDGYEFVRRLRADPSLSQVPVIFSAAHYLTQEAKALAAACGVNSIIAKPCEPEEALRVVDAALAHAGLPEQPAPLESEEFDRERLRLLTDTLAQKSEELRAVNAKLTALIGLGQQMNSELDPLLLLNEYCRQSREIVGASWAAVGMLGADQQTLHYLYIAGLDEEIAGRISHQMPEGGVYDLLAQEGHAYRYPNLTSGSEGAGLPPGFPPVSSLLLLPIAFQERMHGWLCLADKLGADAFSDADERLAQALAAQVGAAYENATLLNVSRRHAAELEREVTERYRMAESLRESESKLSGIIESAMDGIITFDAEQRIVLFNAAAESMFMCPSKEAIGQPVEQFMPERFRAAHAEHVREFGRTRVTIRSMGALGAIFGLRTNGEEFPIEASISQIEASGQRFYTVILRDIAERKRAEEKSRETNQRLEETLAELRAKSDELAQMTQQLWQASKLAVMGELAASVAHELNNPLATVGLRAESLIEQIGADDPKRRALQIIEQEVERMANLVRNLLQFSRRSHQQISTIEVGEEITNTLEFIYYHLNSHNITVEREYAAEAPTVQGDRQQFRQLFLNLLTNASDAMPQGGTLTVRVFPGRMATGVSAAVIEFADTGTGIAPTDLAKIWEPFFTTKPEGKGTGLGLAICRRIVEEHQGTINIESEPGQGTTVRITLPATNGGHGE